MDRYRLERVLLALSVSPVELIVRGSLMYWALFLLFRFILRRDAGSVGVTDFLLVVLLGDAIAERDDWYGRLSG